MAVLLAGGALFVVAAAVLTVASLLTVLCTTAAADLLVDSVRAFGRWAQRYWEWSAPERGGGREAVLPEPPTSGVPPTAAALRGTTAGGGGGDDDDDELRRAIAASLADAAVSGRPAPCALCRPGSESGSRSTQKAKIQVRLRRGGCVVVPHATPFVFFRTQAVSVEMARESQ